MTTLLNQDLDRLFWIIRDGLRDHIDEVNQLLPFVLKKVRPDQLLDGVFGNTATTIKRTLLHYLVIDSRIQYQLLFQDNQRVISYNILDEDGWTPLTYACFFKNHNAVRLLLEHGCNPNRISQPIDILSALISTAIDESSIKILRLLFQYGLDVSIKDTDSLRPLDNFICKYGYRTSLQYEIPFLKELINGGADVNYLDRWNTNALHTVCEYGNMVLAQILLELGCNYNQKDTHGKLPIDEIRHETAKREFLEMIENLTLR